MSLIYLVKRVIIYINNKKTNYIAKNLIALIKPTLLINILLCLII